MSRALSSIILLLVFSLHGFSQDWDAVRADHSLVWGEGWGRTVEEADAQALSALASRIAVAVSSDFRQVEQQVRSASGCDYSLMQSSSTSACSGITLMNTSQVILSSGRRSHVGRWISLEDLGRIVADRTGRILGFEKDALRAELSGFLDAALRCHYWAYCLLRTLPRPSEVTGPDGRRLVNSISNDIARILDDISIEAVSRNGDIITLSFFCGNDVVRSLDFSYFDGARWQRGRVSGSSRCRIEMAPGALAQTLQIRIEYEYASRAASDNELREVTRTSGRPFARSAFKSFRRNS